MKRILILAGLVSAALVGAWGAITVYDQSLKVGRMWETPAVKPHEAPIPAMTAGVVPFDGGEAQLRAGDAHALAPPLDLKDPGAIARGREGYVKFCIQCHGKHHDGNATVGQSFAPLPGDLRSGKVQSMAAGRLFREISYGTPGGRQPPLASTIEESDRWRIIAFVLSLGTRP